MPKYWALGAVLTVSIGWPLAATADVNIPDEFAKMIQQRSQIGTLDGGLFGDHVSLSTGDLEIVQTDVDLPGNNALAVRVGRRFRPGNYPADGNFADWDLDIPHLHGVFANVPFQGGWSVAPDDVLSDHRCSEFGAPPVVFPPQQGEWNPEEYWHGTFLYLPGSGDQELLRGGDRPTSGGPYTTGTKEGAVARCLSTLAPTSEAGSTGEGFEVVTPDGTTYTFDQMFSRYADGVEKADIVPEALRSKRGSRGVQGVDVGTDAAATCCHVKRVEIFLYPTKVTDRFGNTVTYKWSTINPGRLEEISSSDNRHLYLTYSSSDSSSRLVQSVSDGVHQWSYAYSGGTVPGLATVSQPDSSSWQFTLGELYISAKPTPRGITCHSIDSPGTGVWHGTITAPSGAQVQYTLAPTVFGRSWVYWDCKRADGVETPTEPNLFVNVAITGKTVTGPGLPTAGLVWSYGYGPPNNCWDPAYVDDPNAVTCDGNSLTTRTTTVTEPDGSRSHYTFGNRRANLYGLLGNEGLLKSEDRTTSTGSVLRSTVYEYGDGDAEPYGSHQGASLRAHGDGSITGKRRPQRSAIRTQQTRSFSWSVPNTCGGNYCFDTWARPTTVVRSGPNGIGTTTRTEDTAYDDDTARWVLGQIKSRTIAGIVASSTTFDASHRPWKVYAFGKLQDTFTYNADGTIATVADGRGNVTTYSGWKLGIPTSVQFPGAPARTAVVDDWGRITSVKDENGYETGYEYDSMGRLTKVTYPGTGWAATQSAFTRMTTNEYGLAAGHWKQTTFTGSGKKETLFDALWRPVLVREYISDVTGLDRYVATAYDYSGRAIDTSYPLGSSPGSGLSLGEDTNGKQKWLLSGGRPKGVRTTYDALGRPTLVQQDSEFDPPYDVLATTTAYLSGFKRRVTDARGKATTEQFMAWDTPNYDLPVRIDAPESQTTTITRDIFGKPTSITRGESP
jgi:YD repeat-containing protein